MQSALRHRPHSARRPRRPRRPCWPSKGRRGRSNRRKPATPKRRRRHLWGQVHASCGSLPRSLVQMLFGASHADARRKRRSWSFRWCHQTVPHGRDKTYYASCSSPTAAAAPPTAHHTLNPNHVLGTLRTASQKSKHRIERKNAGKMQ